MVSRPNLFSKPKDKRLARIISIKTPTQFNNSIRELKKRGITLKEKRALVLAQNRARAQLKRKNLSTRERNQFKKIVDVKLPRMKK